MSEEGEGESVLDKKRYIHNSGYMESEDAILALAALAQSTRLDVFRLLAKHEPEGLAAGDIAKALTVPQNTMSSHLSVLSRAGLVSAQRFSRSMVYRADLARFQAVVLFMLRDCCGGRPEICAPLIEILTPCCPPPQPKRKVQRKAHV
jgi:ArsR family transcriptional regulator